MDCFLYKFSVKPLPKAHRVFSAVTIAILVVYFISIYGFAYWIDNYYSFASHMIATGVIALLMIPPLQNWFWLAGKFKFTDAGILSKHFLHTKKLIRWETVCNIKRTTVKQGRNEHIDVLLFYLDTVRKKDSVIEQKEQTHDWYFMRQKQYFVIMYSEDREDYLIGRGFQIEVLNAKKR